MYWVKLLLHCKTVDLSYGQIDSNNSVSAFVSFIKRIVFLCVAVDGFMVSRIKLHRKQNLFSNPPSYSITALTVNNFHLRRTGSTKMEGLRTQIWATGEANRKDGASARKRSKDRC